MDLPRAAIHDRRKPEALGPATFRIAGLAGLAGIAASAGIMLAGIGSAASFWEAYLTAFTYFLSLSLGALFFVLLQHLTRSGWSVVVRRFAEGIAANVSLLALLFLPILLFGMKTLYPWAGADAAARDALLQGKRVYLDVPFFAARWVLYFAAWGLTARYFLSRSIAQDATGDPRITVSMERTSGPAMILFAFTITFAAFDLLMSLDPHWYSTIYGVYFFSGGTLGFFALLTIVAWATQRAGRLEHTITAEHYHDLGKLMFAFTVFWAYIAFSQYLLIWYGNIPEETTWYLRRQTNGWGAAGLFLLFGHFMVPFAALLSRFPKRNKNLLVVPAVWLLIMHWIDLYWLIVPEGGMEPFPPHPLHATLLLGFAGLSVAAAARRLGNRPLIPEKDPRLEESVAFENA